MHNPLSKYIYINIKALCVQESHDVPLEINFFVSIRISFLICRLKLQNKRLEIFKMQKIGVLIQSTYILFSSLYPKTYWKNLDKYYWENIASNGIYFAAAVADGQWGPPQRVPHRKKIRLDTGGGGVNIAQGWRTIRWFYCEKNSSLRHRAGRLSSFV